MSRSCQCQHGMCPTVMPTSMVPAMTGMWSALWSRNAKLCAGEAAACVCFWEAQVLHRPSSPDSSGSSSGGSGDTDSCNSDSSLAAEDVQWDVDAVQTPAQDGGAGDQTPGATSFPAFVPLLHGLVPAQSAYWHAPCGMAS